MSSLGHKCAVCGVIGNPDSVPITLAGQISMQHRGQGQFGVAARGRKTIQQIRRQGLVSNSINKSIFRRLRGNPVIGHNRYPTAGPATLENAQPHMSNDKQLALCSNGDIVPTNYQFWRDAMVAKGYDPISDNDGELLMKIVEWRLDRGDDIIAVLQFLQKYVIGAFSCLVIYDDQLIACRDRHGFRPLVYGGRNDETTRFVASESCAMVAMGADYWEEIEPGEIRAINRDGSFNQYKLPPLAHLSQCPFEFDYFGFPTSTIFGIPVSLFRERRGAQLIGTMPTDADLVMSVPDSSNNAAVGLANASGVPPAHGLVRPHYQGRSFIAPNLDERARIASQKLIADPAILNGQSAVVVDDSIVRGITSQQMVTNLRQAGARLIHLRIIAPPVRFPCFYGISTPTKEELIANNKTVEEIRQFIGADSLVYLTVDDLKAAILSFGMNPDDFCYACYTGNYPTPL